MSLAQMSDHIHNMAYLKGDQTLGPVTTATALFRQSIG